MEEEGYLDCWVLPSADLYDNHPDLKKRFNLNPIGKSPENNPWDLRSNEKVHISHNDHVVLTRHLPEDHPHKFSGSTPKRMSYSYCRLIDRNLGGISPTSEKKLQDINQISVSYQ